MECYIFGFVRTASVQSI